MKYNCQRALENRKSSDLDVFHCWGGGGVEAAAFEEPCHAGENAMQQCLSDLMLLGDFSKGYSN